MHERKYVTKIFVVIMYKYRSVYLDKPESERAAQTGD